MDEQETRTIKLIFLLFCIAFAIILLAFAYRDRMIISKYNDLAEESNEIYERCKECLGLEKEVKTQEFKFNFTIS